MINQQNSIITKLLINNIMKYNGNIKTVKITTDKNGEIISKQEESIIDWTDNNLKDFTDKLTEGDNIVVDQSVKNEE
jgi:hypothetical protein